MKVKHYLVTVCLLAVLCTACGATSGASITKEPPVNDEASTNIAYIAWRETLDKRSIYVWNPRADVEKKVSGDLERIEPKFSWSPDGTQLVFQNGGEYTKAELYTANLQTGELKKLVGDKQLGTSPDWSPCGDWIAFDSGVNPAGDYSVWLVNPTDRETRPLISNPSFSNLSFFPLWDPQAAKLAVILWLPNGQSTWGIFDVKTGHKILIVERNEGQLGAAAYLATWRPDGKEFAYTDNQDGMFNIYAQTVGDGDSSLPKKLTDLSCHASTPVWHPNEPIILFTCFDLEDSDSPSGQLYTVNIETLQVRQLTNEGNNFYGDWSPDGEQIAFTAKRDGYDYLAIMDADGSNLTVLEETKSKQIWMAKWAPAPELRCNHTSVGPAPTLQSATIILAPDVPDEISSDSLQIARDVLQSRLNDMLRWSGRDTEVIVEANNLRVDLDRTYDISITADLASQIGEIMFFDSVASAEIGESVPEDAKLVMTDDDIYQAEISPAIEEWLISISLTPQDSQRIIEHISTNSDHYLVVARDGFVIASLPAESSIIGDKVIIMADLDQFAAQFLAAELNYGELPFKFIVEEVIIGEREP